MALLAASFNVVRILMICAALSTSFLHFSFLNQPLRLGLERFNRIAGKRLPVTAVRRGRRIIVFSEGGSRGVLKKQTKWPADYPEGVDISPAHGEDYTRAAPAPRADWTRPFILASARSPSRKQVSSV